MAPPLTISNRLPPRSNGAAPLRLAVLDALMAAKGYRKEAEKARAFGINVSYWFGIRAGKKEPSVALALRIARVAGTTVEALWAERPDQPRAGAA